MGGTTSASARTRVAMVSHPEQFDYYDGACGRDLYGLGEPGWRGQRQLTKMGSRCNRAGGFDDITQNAKTVVFPGTFTRLRRQVPL